MSLLILTNLSKSVLLILGFGIGRERGSRQQKDEDYPQARSPGREKRRGVGEVASRSHHCSRRCSSQHKPGSAPEEIRGERGKGFAKNSQVS